MYGTRDAAEKWPTKTSRVAVASELSSQPGSDLETVFVSHTVCFAGLSPVLERPLSEGSKIHPRNPKSEFVESLIGNPQRNVEVPPSILTPFSLLNI